MVKLGALFIVTLLFLFVGAYLQKNPEWLRPYQRQLSQNQVIPSMVAFTPNPTAPTLDPLWLRFTQPGAYRIDYPPQWQMQTDVPGCGPVWFAPGTKKVWMTICGPSTDSITSLSENAITVDNPLLSRETVLVSGKQGIRQEIKLENGRVTQIFVESKKGVYAIYFTHLLLESSVDYLGVFNEILSTFTLL